MYILYHQSVDIFCRRLKFWDVTSYVERVLDVEELVGFILQSRVVHGIHDPEGTAVLRIPL
jgi:hypothetical protein